MLTLTPVALVKVSISATNASSSDCTKYFQRNIESCAPCSGFHGALCAQALAQSSSAGPVSAPAASVAVPPCTNARRVKMIMLFSLVISRFADFRLASCVEPLACRLVEQVDEMRGGPEPDLVARLELVAFAEDGDHFLAAELGEHLRLRAGRLDHHDLGLGAVVGDRAVLGADAGDRGPAVGLGWGRREGD